MKYWTFTEWFGYSIFAVTGLLLLLVAIRDINGMIWEHNHPCIRSHKGMVYHPAYTSMLPGRPTFFIYHPDKDSCDEICDERKP